MKIKTIIIASIIGNLISLSAKGQDIKVHIVHSTNDGSYVDQITMKNNKKVLDKILTDKNGFATISSSMVSDSVEYDLYLTSIGVRENYVTTINAKTNRLLEIQLPKKYKMRFGKAICPKCNRINKVVKVVYCEAPIVVLKVAKGDTIFSPIYRHKYYMPDVTSNLDPKWYCEKDDLLF